MRRRNAPAESYGDSEPEDAYDATDPVPILMRNVARRLRLAADDLHTLADRVEGDGQRLSD